MKILEHIISTLDFSATVQDIRQGVFQTAVLTRYCGLASTLPGEALEQDPPMVKEPGCLTDKTPEQLVELVYSNRILESVIGMATINSLLDIDIDRCEELNARELILEKGEGQDIVIVGHFPFIPRVREKAKSLWVIEKNPHPGDAEEYQAEELIPGAAVVAITGTALPNHTMDHLLSLCRPESFVILLGDSVPLTPIFFDYGVDALCGTQVIDPEAVLRCVSQGANYRQITGIRKLTMIKQ